MSGTKPALQLFVGSGLLPESIADFFAKSFKLLIQIVTTFSCIDNRIFTEELVASLLYRVSL
jgi:hypothetical protein